MLIDMHVHTVDSDGKTHGPDAIKSAEENGLGSIIFANHETNTSGRLDEWRSDDEKTGIKIWGPAIELTTAYHHKDSEEPCLFDVLIYGGVQSDTQFLDKVAAFTDYEFGYYDRCAKELARTHNFEPIPTSEYDHYIDPLTGISHATTRVSRTQLGKLIEDRSDLTVGDFKRQVPRKVYVDTPLDTMTMIGIGLEVGGVVVLAHPGTTIDANGLSERKFFEILGSMKSRGLQGMEVYHPSHSEERSRDFARMANELDLIVTGGSDYHGRKSEYVGEYSCEESAVEVILDNLQES